MVQLDPPRRAPRYLRHDGRLHSVRPDAFRVLRNEGKTLRFFLECARRAVRPVTMAARLAPCLRYYSSHRPTDDHGTQPVMLVVFDDEIAQTHFLRVAREEVVQWKVEVPMWVSHRNAIEKMGSLGRHGLVCTMRVKSRAVVMHQYSVRPLTSSLTHAIC